MLHRTVSWRQLLNLHKHEFITWLDGSGRRLHIFNKLAEDLERYILESLTPGPYEEDLSTEETCRQFARLTPGVFSNCDDPQLYEQYMAILAYAHVHLLERYRRFWDVLLCLLNAAVLPMSEKGLEVLDVGTGPAPALYATSDFYQELRDFATEKKEISLVTPLPNLNSVEISSNWEHFMHTLSEVSERTRGPYSFTFRDFKGLDFAKLRRSKRRT